MIKHHFSFVTLNNDGIPASMFINLQHPTFFKGNHPLQSLCERMLDVFGYDAVDALNVNPAANAVRIANLMFHDTYNNGTGNARYWSNKKEFCKSLRKAGYDKEVIKHLESRYSEVFESMARGRNFGWVREGELPYLKLAIERLQTDVTYFAAKQMFPAELATLEAELSTPYAYD